MAHKKPNTMLRDPHVPLDIHAIQMPTRIEITLEQLGHACGAAHLCGLAGWECAIVYGPVD